jgi:hypothetical protein
MVMSDLAEELRLHLDWNRPLERLQQLRFDGTHSWLTEQIEVFFDFDWTSTIGHKAQTFKHYRSLSDYVCAQ